MADPGVPVSEPARLVHEILFRLNREVVDALSGARTIAHPGESGRARENVVADALKRFLPDAFGISTGFVIDSAGGTSRQQDIVVYRRGYHPVFMVGGISHFMVESVAAVIQTRASITSRESLIDALDTISSAKRLDRTNGGTNYVVHGSNRGEAVDADNFFHQVWGAIVTEASLTYETLGGTVVEFLGDHDRRLWPNLYADVNGRAGLYQREDGSLTDSPTQADRFVLTEPDGSPTSIPPFVELLTDLANFLRVIPLVDYKPMSYLPRYAGELRYWRLDAGSGSRDIPEP